MSSPSNIVIYIIIAFLGLIPLLLPELVQLSLIFRILSLVVAFVIFMLYISFNKWWSWVRGVSYKLIRIFAWFAHPLAKILYLLVLFILILYFSIFDYKIILLCGFMLIISLSSIKWFPVSRSKFKDSFNNLTSWNVISGNPSINFKFGNPPPNLDLHLVSGGTNCLLYFIPVDTPKNGSIECDVYIEPWSLINIVFHVDSVSEKWYMARLDTRNGFKDGFLKGGRSGWSELSMAKNNSSPKTWHRMKIELNNSKVKLYRGGNLLATMNDSELQKGKVGVFNEDGEVHIDNFQVTKEK